MLQEGTSGQPQEESLPGEAPPEPGGKPLGKHTGEEFLQEGGIEQPEQPLPLKRPPLEEFLAGSLSHQQHGHACLEVALSVTRSGAAGTFFSLSLALAAIRTPLISRRSIASKGMLSFLK